MIRRQHDSGRSGIRLGGLALSLALLAVPLVAMQFTDEVQWTAYDFTVAAALLLGVGAAIDIGFRVSCRPAIRTAAAVSAVLAGLAIWADGAVGLF